MIPGVSGPEVVLYVVASFLAAVLSGIAGGGGGFINTPLLIFLGLNPAQAVSTGKLCGLTISLTSLGGMRAVPQRSRKQLLAIMAVALVIGLLAPLFITRLEEDMYRRILGLVLLLMIPVLILKKVGRAEHQPSPAKKAGGYILLVLSMCLQAVFSGGLGTLVNIVLMAFLGMPALEATVTKRYSQLILNAVIVLGVLRAGLIVWPVALVGIVTSGIGGYIGGKIAVKRGNGFVMAIFIVLMAVSAAELLFG